ncbi:MAG: hypothetical protein OEW39_02980 [Deltaproteobacteria bacterium]|nr:hypothetical protein [Deltaproteobacteria bacterium]
MFGKNPAEPTAPVLMDAEGRFMAHLTREAYGWLGARYTWYNKIREAKKGGFQLFKEKGLEEQMEATRSALSLISKTLHSNLLVAYNGLMDAVKNSGAAPEGWPARIEAGTPVSLVDRHDAFLVAYSPFKFLNLAKPVRDKGKGLDYYVDGLIKKFMFKVIGYYCEPLNWKPERLAYFLQTLGPEANLQEVQGRLSGLKTDVGILCMTYQMLRFGRLKGRQDVSVKNTLEETFNISDEELVKDLYFQSWLVNGMSGFVFRYYLTLLAACQNRLAYKQVALIFHPLLAKVEEIQQQFQSSFGMEREKARLREPYMNLARDMEARSPVEILEVKGKQVKRINYNMRRLETMLYIHSGQISPRMLENWKVYLNRDLLSRKDITLAFNHLLELLNTLLVTSQNAMEGRIKVAQLLRQFTDDQEKMGRQQITLKKRALEEAKRKKSREMAKFKSQEQAEMVGIVKKELEDMESQGKLHLANMEKAMTARRESHLAKVAQLETTAREDREKNLGKSGGLIFQILVELDATHHLRGELASQLSNHIQEDKDSHYDGLYKQLWGVLTDLSPAEKTVLRNVVDNKLHLEPNELIISDEDKQAYQQQIDARIAEMETELPGVMDSRPAQGQANCTLRDLIGFGLTLPSLRLVLQLPFMSSAMAPNKLPPTVVKKALRVNHLMHPFPKHDIVLPNVDESQPPLKRINFNRLQKLPS